MTKIELDSLSVDDIKLILIDQQELYNEDEISQLQKRLKYLQTQNQKDQPKKRPEKFNCPKCGAQNKSTNIMCPYCEYKFKEQDYFNIATDDNINVENSKNNNSNTALYIIALLLPVVGVILGIVYIAKDKEELGKSLIIFSIIVFIVGMIFYLSIFNH
jgi:transcription elongation factor Elf1